MCLEEALWPAPRPVIHFINDTTSFFFQAEDGIRSLTVTGVQTCALPILRRLRRLTRFGGPCVALPVRFLLRTAALRLRIPSGECNNGVLLRRSEERRVGKEIWTCVLRKRSGPLQGRSYISSMTPPVFFFKRRTAYDL